MWLTALALSVLQDPTAGEWTPAAVRDELAPRSWVESVDGTPCLGLAGCGDDAVDGRWTRTVPVEVGRWYRFSARYRARHVPQPRRSILARLVWLDASGAPLRPMEYPHTAPHADPDGWTPVAGLYRAPERAARARLELHLRWAARGEVLFRDAALAPSEPPAPRRVVLASVHHRPRKPAAPRENLERFGKLVEEAARRKADIVCLPEGVTVVGTGRTYAEAAEPVPGPSTQFLGELAARLRVWIVAGIYERDGGRVYNTAVLLGRDGALTGKYRKVCLPDEEIEGGITPGSDYPVFDTDFGRIGIFICWDVHFPEVARELASRGAEVLFLPIWGGNELLAQARAVENQVHLVASGYDFRTGIFDPTGRRIADASTDPEVIVAEVDLNERRVWPWLGEWRARIWREAPPRR
jgi:predicted amidohydrolase